MKDRILSPTGRGFGPTRRALVQVIKLTTKHDLTKESKWLFNQFDSWVKNEGLRSATLRLKTIYHTVLNSSLGQIPPEYPFLATTRGFPRIVLYLERFKTSPEGIQAILTLLGFWRGIRCPGTPDLSTITDESSVEYQLDLEKMIVSCIPRKWQFRCDQLQQVTHHYSSSYGPNGKSLLTSLSDLKALKDSPNLIDAINEILDLTNSEEFSENLEELIENVKWNEIPATVTHSRLSVKQELGGKDRVFAMVDYFTQSTLRPLHKKLAEILGTIPQDGTFNQDRAAEEIRTWTEGTIPLFSYDLSAATDRLPVRLQKAIMGKLVGSSSFADAWADLMTNRNFKFRRLSGIRYAVGQPMGAYSSWPAFAITHHIIVLCAAKLAKIPHPEYKILGDDIVLRSEALASSYLRIMKTLGVKISLTKTVTGKVAEFAKRIFTQGGEISPIPVKLLSATLKDYRLIGPLRERLIGSSFSPSSDFYSVQSGLNELLPTFYKGEVLKKARILLSLPSQGAARVEALQNLVGNFGFSYTESLERDYDMLVLAIKYKYLIQRYAQSQKEAQQGMNPCRTVYKATELPGLDTGYLDLHPYTQAKTAQLKAAKQAHRELGKFWTELTRLGPKATLPNVNLPSMKDLIPSHRKRLKQEATLQLQIYSAFKRFIEKKKEHPDHTIFEFLKDQMKPGGSS